MLNGSLRTATATQPLSVTVTHSPCGVAFLPAALTARQRPSPGQNALPPRLGRSPPAFGYSPAGLTGCGMRQRALPDGIDLPPRGRRDPRLQPCVPSLPGILCPALGTCEQPEPLRTLSESSTLRRRQGEPGRTQHPDALMLLSHPFPHFQFKPFCALARMRDVAQDSSKSCGDVAHLPRGI